MFHHAPNQESGLDSAVPSDCLADACEGITGPGCGLNLFDARYRVPGCFL